MTNDVSSLIVEAGLVTTIAQRPDMTRTILRNAFALTAGEWAARLLNFAFMIYVIRLLGEAGFGRFSTVIAFVGLFGVFFELGMGQYVERTIAQDRTRAQALFWNLVVLRLLLASAGVVVITGLALLVGYDRTLVLGVLLFTLTFMLAAFLFPLTTVLTANERFDVTSAIQLVAQALTMGLGILFLEIGLGFLSLVYTGFAVMPVQIALTIWAIHRLRLGPIRFQIAPSTWPAFVRASLPFGLTSLALTFNYNVDTVILGLFSSASAVGWYNAAYRLVFNLTSLASGFSRAATPSLAREHVTNPQRVHAWTRASVQALALVALPAAVGVCILAPRIVSLLYGDAYAPAARTLALIVWDVPLVVFCAYCGNVSAAVGLERPASRIYLASAGLNVVLNFLLIPWFGIMAAAAVTVLTDGITAILFYRLLSKEMALNQARDGVLRAALAAGLMGAVVWLVRPLPLPIVIVTGAISYAILVLRMRLIDNQRLISTTRKVFGL